MEAIDEWVKENLKFTVNVKSFLMLQKCLDDSEGSFQLLIFSLYAIIVCMPQIVSMIMVGFSTILKYRKLIYQIQDLIEKTSWKWSPMRNIGSSLNYTHSDYSGEKSSILIQLYTAYQHLNYIYNVCTKY